MDLWFTVDGSESVSDEQFQDEIGFVSNIASQCKVSQSKTRIGLSVYSDKNYVVVQLQDTTNLEDFQLLANTAIKLKSMVTLDSEKAIN